MAMECDPLRAGEAEARFSFACKLLEKNLTGEAEAEFRKVLDLQPANPESHYCLANILAARGDSPGAEQHYRAALASMPTFIQALNNLGCLLEARADMAEAAHFFQRALVINPHYAEAHFNFALLLHKCGESAEAERHYREASRCRENYGEAHYNLGLLLKGLHRLTEAESEYRAVLRCDSRSFPALTNLGIVLRMQGDLQGALQCYRSALSVAPECMQAHQNLLFLLGFLPGLSEQEIFAEHRRFAERFAAPPRVERSPSENSRDTNRPLRIGFVSPDFREHPVFYLFRPVLANHERNSCEMICYSNAGRPDWATAALQALADGWRDISGMDDEEAENCIRSDGIDILVDLAGHTSGNRILLFSRRVAPVQVEWLGYWNTSGLDTIDYIISDDNSTPLSSRQIFSERVFRLPHARFCYGGNADAPLPSSSPCRENGFVTFGCFNNLSKINEQVILLWAKLLRQIPSSRLVLKSMIFCDEPCRALVAGRFAAHGIAGERLSLLPGSSHAEMLDEYSLIDIALDTFPFPGGMTTCEALWMGVPVVALSGRSMISRQADMILTAAGFPEWIARDEEEYLRLAGELALDPDRLAEIRRSLRDRLNNSVLMDAAGLTRNLENAFHSMWRESCAPTSGEGAGSEDTGYEAAVSHYNHAITLAGKGASQEAEKNLRMALQLHPSFPQALNNLGVLLERSGRLEEATAMYREALRQMPSYAEAAINFAILLHRQRLFAEATELLRDALRRSPDHPRLLHNLGNMLMAQGNPAEAVRFLAEARRHDPSLFNASTNLLYGLYYLPDMSPQEILDGHSAFFRQCLSSLKPSPPFDNNPDPRRRMRVGFLSPDFRRHSVAYFLEPALRHLDRQKVEIFCYANLSTPDDVTQCFRKIADNWRDVLGMTDDDLIRQTRKDRIDILVDLAGLTAGNRILVFARRAAPIQVSWLGYPGTTGVGTIDYRFTDAWADPAGVSDSHCSEKLIRLPETFLCYQPPDPSPPVSPLPVDSTGIVTFASFNNIAKVSGQVLSLWAELLRNLPQARLLVKGKALTDPCVREETRKRFLDAGIPGGQLELSGWTETTESHLQLYGEVDIALDTFPYNGTATTCEALWMGVPVVTLAGDRHSARVGASILTNAGFAELIAETPARYLEIAASLAQDRKKLRDLRSNLRRQMQNSALQDAPRFSAAMEREFRHMWEKWCGTHTN